MIENEYPEDEHEIPFVHILRKASECPKMEFKPDPLNAVFFQALPNGGAYLQQETD